MKQILSSALVFPASAENKVYSITFSYMYKGFEGATTLNIAAPSSQDILLKVFRLIIPGYRIFNVRFEEI